MWRISVILSMLWFSQVLANERFLKEEYPSRFLDGNRTIRIYLPASYDRRPEQRYPVLYLHDGQNAYSFAGTNVAFGWGNWELDKTVDRLAGEGKMSEVLLVAVDNSPARFAEYCGAHHAGTNKNTAFENYAAFLIEELKPRIDARFRTRSEPAETGVMGSSMGGICSLILAWEHPDVFGLAASLSGAFMVEHTNFLEQVLRKGREPAKPFCAYLDSGVTDFMGGDDGHNLTEAVAGELRRMGWHAVAPARSLAELTGSKRPTKSKEPKGASSVMHYVDSKPLTPADLEKTGLRRDKWAEAQTSQHNEFYWRLRAWRPLIFLFPPGD